MSHLGAFHHVGLACRTLESEAPALEALGYSAEGPPIEDPVQKVRVQFYGGAGPRIELIEPLGAGSPIEAILKRGIKFYHLAYEVGVLEDAIERLENQGYRPVGPAAPAAAFNMRRIIFLMSSTFTLIELIEAEPPA